MKPVDGMYRQISPEPLIGENFNGLESEAPTTARYHRQAVEQILQCVEDGVYCAVLGPRLSGKTVLLRFVERLLAESFGYTTIYIAARFGGKLTDNNAIKVIAT